MSLGLVWFRRDLRLRDNEVLTEALRQFDQILPVYVLDPREWGKSPYGFRRTGVFRTRFLRESLGVLRRGLQNRAGDLWVAKGEPEEVLPDLVRRYGVSGVFASKEVTWEEEQVERRLVEGLEGVCSVRWFRGQTLVHPADLPFEVGSLPMVFTAFRRRVEAAWVVRPELPTPGLISCPENIERSGVADLDGDWSGEAVDDERSVLRFRGGETEGLGRLESYIWVGDHLRNYKETRNGLVGADYSSKLSPWLALGSLSPRTVYFEVQRYESERVKNESTYWLVFELLWRDFFRFLAEKVGRQLFCSKGFRNNLMPAGGRDSLVISRWLEGRTGRAFVDAGMRELRLTGYLSNRMRQNVASYFVHDLGQDWRIGAEWFESALVDYDVCSNWGNWAYLAGVGTDPREGRRFNVEGQAERYDPEGEYRKLWVER
jgi:deoxyribodipyrimidine photo-lyase